VVFKDPKKFTAQEKVEGVERHGLLPRAREET
jgi:hypothetical protein